MVDDDDDDEPPSPEPRTDSKSALPKGFRAWRRLRIVKRDDFFSLIFSHRNSIYGGGVGVGDATGAHEVGGRALGGAHPREKGVGPLVFIFGEDFFIFSKMFRGVSGHSENFYFCTIITPWQFC